MCYPFERFSLQSRSIVLSSLVALSLSAPDDAPAGELAYLQHASPVVGIIDVTRLVVSPDGADLYLSGDNDTLSHFRIDEPSGAVDIVHVYREGVAGVHGLLNFNTMVIAPTGDHLYISSGGNTGELVTLSRDADGLLTCLGSYTDSHRLAVDPLFWRMAASPDGRHLYVTGSNGAFPNSELVIFTFSQPSPDEAVSLTSVLSAGRVQHSGDRWLADIFVAVGPGGDHVVTGNFEAETVKSFSRDLVTGELALVDTVRSGDPGVSGLGDMVELNLSPDGRDVYVASGLGDWRVQIRLDPSTGDLAFVDAFQADPGGFVADEHRPLTFSADGRHAYLCVQGFGGGGGIEAYRRNETTGQLTLFAYLQSTNHEFECPDMTLSPTGSWLFTVGLWGQYLVTYQRYDASGLLIFDNQTRGKSPFPAGFSETDTVQLDPTGTRLYIPAREASQIVVLDRDPSDGTVAPLTAFTNGENGFDGSPAPIGIAFSSDGEYAYVSNCGPWPDEGEETIGVYEFDPQSGGLALIQVIDAQYAPHYDCWGINVLTVDDPTFVHAFSQGFAVTYQRDAFSGELAEIGRIELPGARMRSPIAAGAQDSSVYAGDFNDPGGVITFLRDPVSGVLSYEGIEDQSSCSVPTGEPLRYLSSVAAGPGDAYIWVLGGSHVIQTFDRDPTTGALAYSNCDGYASVGVAPHPFLARLATVYDMTSYRAVRWHRFDPVSGLLGLKEDHAAYGAALRAPIVSGDGKNLYAPYGCGGLGVFLVAPIFNDGFESGDSTAWTEVSR